jgi:dipeptidyl aminopeptidase/acylaminoacyl peptidase
VTAFSAPIGIDVVAVVSSDHVSPCEVYLVHVHRDKDAEAPLTRLNAEWASAGPFGSVHRLGVSRGDDTLSVWIYLPAGASQSDPGSVPVLLNIHGGPHAQYGDRFFDEFAVYCGAGYAVVYTNPRGSTGRTERFARAVQGDWGGIDAADVLAAVDGAVHAFPCLDATRLGIMGGSYGGYLTSWIVSHDHRFKAACSERAVNDFESFAATSDIGFWFAEGQLGASPFLEPALAAKHSPLRYAAQITTPILILHGEEDYRCPIEQAERLYVSLARRGHAVRFVRMPDADHELSRTGRPGQRVERFRQILDWFASYLLPSNKGHDD